MISNIEHNSSHVSTFPQADLDPRALTKVLDDADEISKDNFIKLATETKLTDFPMDRELSSRIGLAKAQEEDADRKVHQVLFLTASKRDGVKNNGI